MGIICMWWLVCLLEIDCRFFLKFGDFASYKQQSFIFKSPYKKAFIPTKTFRLIEFRHNAFMRIRHYVVFFSCWCPCTKIILSYFGLRFSESCFLLYPIQLVWIPNLKNVVNKPVNQWKRVQQHSNKLKFTVWKVRERFSELKKIWY